MCSKVDEFEFKNMLNLKAAIFFLLDSYEKVYWSIDVTDGFALNGATSVPKFILH